MNAPRTGEKRSGGKDKEEKQKRKEEDQERSNDAQERTGTRSAHAQSLRKKCKEIRDYA